MIKLKLAGFVAIAMSLTINTISAQEQPELEVVAALDIRPGDVAVSAEGRVFATIHPLGSQQLQLVEIIKGKAVPYPNAAYQKNNEKATDTKFDAMLGLIFDNEYHKKHRYESNRI